METIRLPNSGTVITDSDRGLHIIIPVQKEGLLIVISAFALLLFGMAALEMLFVAPDVIGDPSKPLWFFILVLIALIATDILMIGLIFWNLTGRRIIHVNSIGMILRYKMLGFARERKFELEKIHNLRVRNLKENILPGSTNECMDDETFNASLESHSINSMMFETFFDRLMKVDVTKLHKLRFDDLTRPKDPLAPYRFSQGFCSGILFDYNAERYEFGVGIISGAEAEQVVKAITQRYRILEAKKS